MITNFKIFESSDFSFSDEYYKNLKVGDVVVCIDKSKKMWNRKEGYKDKKISINYGSKYIINKIDGFLISVINYKTNKKIIHPDTGEERFFYIKNFVPEVAWNAKKYNI